MPAVEGFMLEACFLTDLYSSPSWLSGHLSMPLHGQRLQPNTAASRIQIHSLVLSPATLMTCQTLRPTEGVLV